MNQFAMFLGVVLLGLLASINVNAQDKSFFEIRIDERVIKDSIDQVWKYNFQEKVVAMIKDKMKETRPYTNRPEIRFSDMYSALSFEQTSEGMLVRLKIDTDISFLPFSAGAVMKRIHFAGPIEVKAYLVMRDEFLNVSKPEVDFSSINLKGVWFLHPSILASIRKSITRTLTKQEQNIANELPLEVPLIPAMEIDLPVGGSHALKVGLHGMEYRKPDCPPIQDDGKKYVNLESGWIVIRLSTAVVQ